MDYLDEKFALSDKQATEWRDIIVDEYFGKYDIFPAKAFTNHFENYGKVTNMTIEQVDYWFRRKKYNLAYETENYKVTIIPGSFGDKGIVLTSVFINK